MKGDIDIFKKKLEFFCLNPSKEVIFTQDF